MTISVFYHRMRYGGVERVLSILIKTWLRIGYSVVLFADEPCSDEDFCRQGWSSVLCCRRRLE